MSDLDNMFDADDDVDPSSSPDGIPNTDAFLHEHGKGSSLKSAVGSGPIGVSELCQMFPTPPSLEGCLALSPVACHEACSSLDAHSQPQTTHFYDGSAVSTSAATSVLSRCDEKQDSPTRLVRTPLFSKYVASVRYAPIDLPSTGVGPLTTPQWHNLDPKLGKSPSPPSLSSKPVDTASVAGTLHTFPSLNHDSNFFISASPSAASCSSHIVGLDNPSPAPSSFARKTGTAATPVDVSMLASVSQAGVRSLISSLPEADSLVVNLMLSDSLLNLFKDSSFDSCNICICNTNIKGTDVGLYLPDPAKEAQYRCTCGFSAAVNRWNGYCSGLFYEDEADITGIRDGRFDDRRMPLDPTSAVAISTSDAPPAAGESSGALTDMELCAITYSTSFLALHRTRSATRRCLPAAFSPNVDKRRTLHRADIGSILVAALDAGRAAAVGGGLADVVLPSHAAKKFTAACLADWPLPLQVAPAAHSGSRDWPQQSRTTRSADVMAALKSLQIVLQEACHKKRSTRLWDSSYVVSGPLTWKDFHKLAWRGSEDGCKPQPIPSILVGYDKDWVSYSPFVLKYWENLLLRPYGRTHNMAYVVIAPDCSSGTMSSSNSATSNSAGVMSSIRSFFRELSTVYETCQLGRHIPFDRSQNASDGILQLGKKTSARLAQQQQSNSDSDGGKSGGSFASASGSSAWISNFGEDALSKKLKLYAQAFQCILAPLLSQHSIDKTLFESASPARPTLPLPPPPPLLAGAAPTANVGARPGGGSGSMPAPLQPSSSSSSLAYPSASFSSFSQDQLEERPGESLSATTVASDSQKEADECGGEDGSLDDVGLIIYVVEDVTFAPCGKPANLLAAAARAAVPTSTAKADEEDPDDDEEQSTSLTVGLYGVVRCYHELLAGLPESVRSRIQLQIVPLSMVTHIQSGATDGANGSGNCSQLSLMKNLCFSVYSHCQQVQSHAATGRALTSYGPLVSGAASGCAAAGKICVSPYILAPQKDVQARFGTTFSTDGACSGVLLCAYCLSEDQRWLLASVTDENGELRCTKAINMAVTDRSRRKRSLAVHRHGLQKLLDFLLDIIARTCIPWRIVIGRLGRLGHEELKVWATLLNHKCLIRANVRMRGDDCRPCSFLPSATDTPTIVSACLTSLEPHKSFKILTDAVRRLPTHKDKHHAATATSSMSSTMLTGASTNAGNGSGGALGARLLNTPDDVSCTHVLVIPNSTTAGGSQGHHDAPLDLPPDLTDDVGIFDLKEDDFDMLFTLGESPGHTSMDSPGGIGRDALGDATGALGSINNSMTNGLSLMRGLSTSGSGAGGSRSATATAPGAAGMGSDCADDVAPNLLQQPLAMGYYISTAPAGPLPPWFWATCPHEQYACPTSLKFALHFHSFLQQQHQDELVGSTSAAASQSRNASAHPLDSSSTCDVLRFVLEAYDKLSWLTVDASTNDRRSCLPVHVSHLVELSQAITAVSNIVGSG